MSQQNINNGESGLIVRGKLNSNFTELYGRDIYVEDFGAVGDGVTDNTVTFQTAVDYCIANAVNPLRLKSGKTYLISGPVIAYKLSGAAYTIFNLDIIGDVNANAGVTNQCAKIIATHKDTFVFGFQNARSGGIQNVLIQGAYTAGKTSKQIFEGDVTEWAQSGVRDSQFSPYAGVVIDPFGSTVPADGGYPGLSSWYRSTGGSSGVSIRNCTITNFLVDFLISPNGQTSNAESINVYNSRLYNSKVAWASGQSQTRSCALVDSAIFYAQDAINTVTYGAGTGSAASIDRLLISKARNCFNISTSRGDVNIDKVYAEDIWKIGIVSGAKAANFTKCEFKFNFGEGSEGDILAPDTLLGGGGVSYFNNCDFTKPGDGNWNGSFGNQTVFIQGGSIDTFNIPTNISKVSNVKIFGFFTADGGRATGATPAAFYNFHESSARKLGVNNTTFLEHKIRANANSSTLVQASVDITVAANEATFDLTTTEKIQVGDIVYTDEAGYYFLDYTNSNATTATADSAPVLGTVKEINGNTITIKDLRFEATTGNYNIYTQWSSRYSGGIVGTTTNNSNVITNVYKESSVSLVGQRITAADPALLPYGLYIVSEDTNARTLTLSGNLNTSVATMFFYTAFFTTDCIVSVDPSTITGLYVERGQIIRSKSQSLTDKVYFVSSAGIVGNGTHTPVFKTLDMT